jgi:peptidyl-prolyl cis-trans isomerase A (cyclophilin A)/peptidyl-prolyl cis-trans isomerase B (cyclophilin B)
MFFIRLLQAVILAAALTACVGSNETSDPVIDRIVIENTKYGQLGRFVIEGKHLDQEFSVSLSKCTGLAVAEGGLATSKTITCTVNGTGAATIFASFKDKQIYSANFNVPEPQVLMKTSMGDLLIELNPTAAPITVRNFLGYVNDQFYNKTQFHRIEKGFVAQGGWVDLTPAIKNPTRPAITLESTNGLSNLKGTIAMARTNEPNSATSQFYFNLADNLGLDYAQGVRDGHAVFGKIIQGIPVLDAIGQVPIANRYGLATFPAADLIITEVRQTQ